MFQPHKLEALPADRAFPPFDIQRLHNGSIVYFPSHSKIFNESGIKYCIVGSQIVMIKADSFVGSYIVNTPNSDKTGIFIPNQQLEGKVIEDLKTKPRADNELFVETFDFKPLILNYMKEHDVSVWEAYTQLDKSNFPKAVLSQVVEMFIAPLSVSLNQYETTTEGYYFDNCLRDPELIANYTGNNLVVECTVVSAPNPQNGYKREFILGRTFPKMKIQIPAYMMKMRGGYSADHRCMAVEIQNWRELRDAGVIEMSIETGTFEGLIKHAVGVLMVNRNYTSENRLQPWQEGNLDTRTLSLLNGVNISDLSGLSLNKELISSLMLLIKHAYFKGGTYMTLAFDLNRKLQASLKPDEAAAINLLHLLVSYAWQANGSIDSEGKKPFEYPNILKRANSELGLAVRELNNFSDIISPEILEYLQAEAQKISGLKWDELVEMGDEADRVFVTEDLNSKINGFKALGKNPFELFAARFASVDVQSLDKYDLGFLIKVARFLANKRLNTDMVVELSREDWQKVNPDLYRLFTLLIFMSLLENGATVSQSISAEMESTIEVLKKVNPEVLTRIVQLLMSNVAPKLEEPDRERVVDLLAQNVLLERSESKEGHLDLQKLLPTLKNLSQSGRNRLLDHLLSIINTKFNDHERTEARLLLVKEGHLEASPAENILLLAERIAEESEITRDFKFIDELEKADWSAVKIDLRLAKAIYEIGVYLRDGLPHYRSTFPQKLRDYKKDSPNKKVRAILRFIIDLADLGSDDATETHREEVLKVRGILQTAFRELPIDVRDFLSSETEKVMGVPLLTKESIFILDLPNPLTVASLGAEGLQKCWNSMRDSYTSKEILVALDIEVALKSSGDQVLEILSKFLTKLAMINDIYSKISSKEGDIFRVFGKDVDELRKQLIPLVPRISTDVQVAINQIVSEALKDQVEVFEIRTIYSTLEAPTVSSLQNIADRIISAANSDSEKLDLSEFAAFVLNLDMTKICEEDFDSIRQVVDIIIEKDKIDEMQDLPEELNFYRNQLFGEVFSLLRSFALMRKGIDVATVAQNVMLRGASRLHHLPAAVLSKIAEEARFVVKNGALAVDLEKYVSAIVLLEVGILSRRDLNAPEDPTRRKELLLALLNVPLEEMNPDLLAKAMNGIIDGGLNIVNLSKEEIDLWRSFVKRVSEYPRMYQIVLSYMQEEEIMHLVETFALIFSYHSYGSQAARIELLERLNQVYTNGWNTWPEYLREMIIKDLGKLNSPKEFLEKLDMVSK